MNYLTMVTTLPGHEKKKTEFQLVLWVSSCHIFLAQGHFLLVSVNDFITGWLVWTLANWVNKL